MPEGMVCTLRITHIGEGGDLVSAAASPLSEWHLLDASFLLLFPHLLLLLLLLVLLWWGRH
jgi:hypothetical protein